MSAYLLQYNPKDWDWENRFEEICQETQAGKKFYVDWRCKNTQVMVGDRIFLALTGDNPVKGIFGAGHCTKISFKQPNDNKTNYIGVAFDWLIDYKKYPIITNQEIALNKLDILNRYSSGTFIQDADYKKLELMWANLIGIENDLDNLLKTLSDINPDNYDGSYQLVREVIASYKRQNSTNFTFADLDLIYAMSTITKSKSRLERKIDESSLTDAEKSHIKQILDDVWARATNGEYITSDKGVSVGMFGAGFQTFNRKGAVQDLPNVIINKLIEISELNNDEQIYSALDNVPDIKGIGIASFSVMAHCLKPYTFPIINSNEGYGNVFELLGVPCKQDKTIADYARTCRAIKKLRENYNFNNYKIFDDVARMIIKIDLLSTIKYMKNYANFSYTEPSKCAPNEVAQMKQIKKDGQDAVGELKKLAEYIKKEFSLQYDSLIKWLNGKNTKVRDYLWVKMYDAQYNNSKETISIFVNKTIDINGQDKLCIRVSLELIDDGATEQDYANHNKSLDKPLEQGLCYVAVKNGKSTVLPNNVDVIKEEITQGLYKKVQISKVIEYSSTLTNATILEEVIEGIKKIMPYYEYVIQQTATNTLSASRENDINNGASMTNSNRKLSLNTILYGPPGTGKTYNTKKYAVAICENKPLSYYNTMDYSDIQKRYQDLLDNNQICFTTFHQSYCYEDFIEGIKPESEDGVVSYPVKDGCFKEFCKRAGKPNITISNIQFDDDAQIFKVTIVDGGSSSNNAIKKECFDEGYIRLDFSNQPNRAKELLDQIHEGDIVLSLKTRKSIDAIGIALSDDTIELANKKTYKSAKKVKWILKDIDVDIVKYNGGYQLGRKTIHRLPAMRLESVVEILKENQSKKVEAQATPNENKYVFIIDEINRGNISKIFGELITLIEPTKRLGAEEAMEARLPYSRERFGVPDNVYILGTMNTADRSLALIDTALRRRFDFIEMMPDTSILSTVNVNGQTLNIAKMLEVINKRIEVLYDREHTIGHAFFTSLEGNVTIDDLKYIFANKIIPLLQEYFFEDYEKIQLVLGDNNKTDDKYKFIIDETINAKNIFKGNIDDSNLPEKKFSINDQAFEYLESYIQITEV